MIVTLWLQIEKQYIFQKTESANSVTRVIEYQKFFFCLFLLVGRGLACYILSEAYYIVTSSDTCTLKF